MKSKIVTSKAGITISEVFTETEKQTNAHVNQMKMLHGAALKVEVTPFKKKSKKQVDE